MSRNCFSVWMSQDLWLPETVPDSSKRILVISDVSAIVPRSQMLKPKQHRRVLPSLEPLVKTAVYSTCSLLCLPLRVIELCFTRESRASVSPVKSVAPLETGWSVLWQMEKLTTKLAATSGDWSWIIPLIPPRSPQTNSMLSHLPNPDLISKATNSQYSRIKKLLLSLFLMIWPGHAICLLLKVTQILLTQHVTLLTLDFRCRILPPKCPALCVFLLFPAFTSYW